MNRWALRPTDTFTGRRALIGTSMATDACGGLTDPAAVHPLGTFRRTLGMNDLFYSPTRNRGRS